MQGLAAAILCRAGRVLEALRPGGMAPQANPTTPPRHAFLRRPSPSTPGQAPVAGQQALAGLTLGSLPVSASDTPEAGTSTQRTGEVEELGGTPGHGDFGSAYHPADHSRPQYLRQGHVPPDGFQAASLKRRWPWGDKLQESLSLGDGSHPFPEDLLEDIREITLLPGHFAQRGSQHSEPRPPVSPRPGARGPAGGHGPAPDLAGHLATQEGAERGGTGVPGTPPPNGQN